MFSATGDVHCNSQCWLACLHAQSIQACMLHCIRQKAWLEWFLWGSWRGLLGITAVRMLHDFLSMQSVHFVAAIVSKNSFESLQAINLHFLTQHTACPFLHAIPACLDVLM